jgi:hypoxanthine phosphoribosyltransferase
MNSEMLPHDFKLQYSEQAIAAALTKMGGEISGWAGKVFETSGQDILTIPVLRGGLFVFSDLVRSINCSVEIAPARAWAYEVGQAGVQKENVGLNLDGVPAMGRSILIIDDICDSGRTLKTLTAALLKAGAREVRSAVLIKREIGTETFEPDWVGFKYTGSEWFVGYGMDLGERFRNLPSIHVVAPRA